MGPALDRRRLLQLAAFGTGAASLSSAGFAQFLAARGFTHGVASGEPSGRSFLLWTRFVPAAGGSGRLSWQVSPSEDFSTVIANGEAEATEETDYCVKAVAENLHPDRWYFYRFRDSAGQYSLVGRSRTLPEGPSAGFKLALFSCSNLGFGWFNAYGHAAARQDIDLAVHVGDYFYEYQPGRYPGGNEIVRQRLDPPHETVLLADYRLRFAAYRMDPDLQRLHQLLPMVAMWDDHETANNSWQGGAENHQPDTEGDWEVRKAAALRAYAEWMPVSNIRPRSYDIGDLATLIMPETRLTGRSKQLNPVAAIAGQADIAAILTAFRDGPLQDKTRSMLGSTQESWLASKFMQSRGRRATWQILAQQVLVGHVAMPFEIRDWVPPSAPEAAKARAQLLFAQSQLDLPIYMDSWDGYPAARTRLFEASLAADANLLVLSGDTHNAWALDLAQGNAAVGVEIGGQSVTSPGGERDLAHLPAGTFAKALAGRNPQLRWSNNHQRGYATVELTPDRATAEWIFMETVRRRSTAVAATHSLTSFAGARRFAA